MCALYTLRSPADLLAVRFGLPQAADLKLRYNIVPSQFIPVIGAKAGGGRGLAMFKWGFVPHWAYVRRFPGSTRTRDSWGKSQKALEM